MKNYLKKEYFKNILTLTAGSFVAQIVHVLCFPIITRIFSQSEIGLYTFVLSFAAIFLGIANGRFDLSIIKENKKENIPPLIKLSLIVGLLMTILASFVYIVYLLIQPQEIEMVPFWTLSFFVIIIFTYVLLNILTAYNNREKEYKIISFVYVLRGVSQEFLAVLLGLTIKIGAASLLLSYSIGQFIGVKKQYFPLRKRKNEILFSDMKSLKRVFSLHKNQLYYSTPAQLINSLSYSAITIFVKSLFSLSTVGLYSMSVRLLGLPLSLVAGNVSKVYYESAVEEFNMKNGMPNAFKKTFIFQLLLAIPMVLFMFFLGPSLCAFFLGESWSEAGRYIQILAPMFGIRFIVTVLMPTFIIVNKQKLEFYCQIIFVFALITSFILTRIYQSNIEFFLASISFSYSIVYSVVLMMVYKYTRIQKIN